MIIFIYMCKVIDKCSIDNKQLHVIIESVIHVGNSEEKDAEADEAEFVAELRVRVSAKCQQFMLTNVLTR